jgi:hypothetical protein
VRKVASAYVMWEGRENAMGRANQIRELIIQRENDAG